MSYKNLPPGRERRLTYSNEISLRNTSSNHLRNTFSNHLSNHHLSNPLRNYDYEIMSLLPIIKVGLISKDLFNKSIVKKYNSNDSYTSFCTICQNNIVEDDIIRCLQCRHIFHIDCIDRWFVENKQCPQCRLII